ncbi:hypothetical protein BpHYR1_001794 [Brachionus plicatilis]|uniref:Uncharacterized protein n=1 Tax=Brachionus plicatilis TaxID=10195 RepID=A0A3M7RLS7_BRAPC|nr:hypothetical protein BpHYR1_001794 [Brachionus plicatilis]
MGSLCIKNAGKFNWIIKSDYVKSKFFFALEQLSIDSNYIQIYQNNQIYILNWLKFNWIFSFEITINDINI